MKKHQVSLPYTQKMNNDSKEVLVRYTSGLWNNTQRNYSTIKKELLSIVKCITKFESDLLNKKFLLRVDCKSAKDILLKDVKIIASKQIFARWQAILACFDFDIVHISGKSNSLPDFLTKEFLQGSNMENSQRKHSWWIKIQLDDINQFLPT